MNLHAFTKTATFLTLTLLLVTLGCRAESTKGVTTLYPENVHKTHKNQYVHGKVIPPNASWLITAGQVGVDLDGKIVDGIEAQTDWAMKNLYNVIQAAGMGPEDVIKMTVYYTNPDDLGLILATRDRYFGENFQPASTVVVVKSLARPQFLVEVEAIVAAVPGIE